MKYLFRNKDIPANTFGHPYPGGIPGHKLPDAPTLKHPSLNSPPRTGSGAIGRSPIALLALSLVLFTSPGVSFSAPAQSDAPTVRDSAPAGPSQPSGAGSGPLDIRPASQVDETLFLVHVIGCSYDLWPGKLNTETANSWATGQNLMLERLLANAREKRLDPEIIVALDKTSGVFRKYDEFLGEIAAADRAESVQAEKDRDELLNAAVSHLLSENPERYEGDEGKERLLKDAGVEVLKFAFKALLKAADREAETTRRKEAAENLFITFRDSAKLDTVRTAAALASTHNWRDGETGFESGRNTGQTRRRPRDPFLIRDNAMIRQKGEKAEDIARDMEACVLAATLVPDGTVYDQFRAGILASASSLATQAAAQWWFEHDYNYGSAIAERGVRICRARLLYGADVTDIGKHELAQCLNLSGDHAKALEVAVGARGQFNDEGFAYNLACLSSLNGLNQQALDWLGRSFALGGGGVKWCRTDPELAGMRADFPAEFEALTTVQMTGGIGWGWFNHDYKVTNNSKFALSNVRVNPVIVLSDQRFATELTVARIEPGQTYVWENVFKSSTFTKSDLVRCEFGEWDCDQK